MSGELKEGEDRMLPVGVTELSTLTFILFVRLEGGTEVTGLLFAARFSAIELLTQGEERAVVELDIGLFCL
jgi:hypothetical protein